jgi:S1-C subfamily serine protease
VKFVRRIREIKFDTFYRVSILALILLLASTVFYNHYRIENSQNIEDFIFPYDAFVQVEISIVLEREINGYAQTAEFSSMGSGTVIDIIDEHSIVLTANHVCDPLQAGMPLQTNLVRVKDTYIEITGYFGGVYPAEILYSDIDYDLCLLKVEGTWTVPIAIANQPAALGDRVYNMAAPTGFFSPGMVPLFEGFNSGNLGPLGYQDTIYTIPTKGGSSGSPVLNSEGEIIGVTHSAIGGLENIAVACTWEELESFIFRYKLIFKN